MHPWGFPLSFGVARERAGHKSNSVAEITEACSFFTRENQMIQCDTRYGKWMSCCLLYRGDIPSGNVDASIEKIRKMKRFRIELKNKLCKISYRNVTNSTILFRLDRN